MLRNLMGTHILYHSVRLSLVSVAKSHLISLRNKTFNFCSVLTEISQKSFLSICHAPTIITLEKYLEVSVFKNS